MRQGIGVAGTVAVGMWVLLGAALLPQGAAGAEELRAQADRPPERTAAPPPRPRNAEPPQHRDGAATAGRAPDRPGTDAARAPDTAAQEVARERPRGPVTGLDMPRYVSLRAGEGNARRGPGMTHRIDWVFTRRDMPLRVVAEFEHWRRVEDAEGLGGWMHFALLSGMRTVLVKQDMAPLRLQPDPRAPVVAHLEAGVIGRLQTCGPDWCRLRAEGVRGWAEKAALWGVAPDEILD